MEVIRTKNMSIIFVFIFCSCAPPGEDDGGAGNVVIGEQVVNIDSNDKVWTL